MQRACTSQAAAFKLFAPPALVAVNLTEMSCLLPDLDGSASTSAEAAGHQEPRDAAEFLTAWIFTWQEDADAETMGVLTVQGTTPLPTRAESGF